MKVDNAVKKETGYIALGMLIMSAIMHVVFLVIGKWSLGVIYSNVLVGGYMVLNFFLLGLTVQKATESGDEKRAKNTMKLSQTLRFLSLAGVLALGALLSNVGDRSGPFEFWALIPPVFFNRITMMVRGFAVRRESAPPSPPENTDTVDEESGDET